MNPDSKYFSASIARDIEAGIRRSKTIASYANTDALRLTIEADRVRIKIELSPALRGTIHPPELREVREKSKPCSASR